MDTGCTLARLLPELIAVVIGLLHPRRLPSPALPCRYHHPHPALTKVLNLFKLHRLLQTKLATIKAYRRAMGLCFKCGIKWSKEHTCAPEVLHAVEALWDTVADDVCHSSSEVSDEAAEQLCLALSKAAANGSPASRIVRLCGTVAGILVILLIDSGSSTSFISSTVSARLPSSNQCCSLHKFRLLGVVCYIAPEFYI